MFRVVIAAFLLSVASGCLDEAQAAGLWARQTETLVRKARALAKDGEVVENQQAVEAKRVESVRLQAEDARRREHTIVVTGLLAAVVACVGAVLFFRQAKTVAASNAPVYARLQVLDADGREHLMRTTALRVGRSKDNDLALAATSVSQHHAEIT